MSSERIGGHSNHTEILKTVIERADEAMAYGICLHFFRESLDEVEKSEFDRVWGNIVNNAQQKGRRDKRVEEEILRRLT